MQKKLFIENPKITDEEMVQQWLTDPITQRLSLANICRDLNNFDLWFENIVKAKNLILIGISSSTDSPKPIAEAHLDETNHINFSIDPQFRGLGLGKKILKMSSNFFFNSKKIQFLEAFIKRENTKAIICFSKAGYRFAEATTFQGHYCQKYCLKNRNWA